MHRLLPTASSAYEPSTSNEVFFFALTLLALPVAAGALLGQGVRRARGGRVAGPWAMLAGLALPTAAGVAAAGASTTVGAWDGFAEGLLLGLGLAATAHAAFADRRATLVALTTAAAGLLLLEGASRLLLPPAPAFPAGTPHFFLNPAFRRNEPMFGGGQDHVCTLVYPGLYRSRFTAGADSALPVRAPGPAAPAAPTRRVLHLGDSVAYGFSVADGETYESDLERLEPGVRHINGAIIGTGPDSYFALLRRWAAEQHPDLVVVDLFEGNDLSEIDKGHQCSEWRPLLAYGPRGAALRFERPREAHALWERTRSTSPPPYLLRLAVRRSKVAALLAAAMAALQTPDVNANESDEVRWRHLRLILMAVRDELRGRGIPVVVVVLPLRGEVERGAAGAIAARMARTSREVGLPTLDPGDDIRAAAARGAQLFIDPHGTDSHLSAAGHRMLADWLHARLPAAATAAP